MYMFLRICFDGSMRHKRKNVCALHRITYLTAAAASAASAADNQKRLRDNAGCNLPSRREVWREKSVRATLTALVTQLALNPRQSGTCGGGGKKPSRPPAGVLPSACCQSVLSPQRVERVGLLPSESKCTRGPYRIRPKLLGACECVDEATSSRFLSTTPPAPQLYCCLPQRERQVEAKSTRAGVFCKANAFLSALWYQRRGSHLCKPHFASIFSQHMSSKLFKN